MTNVVTTPIIFFFSTLTIFLLVSADKHGFSMELIHRDSPKSPSYNPLDTHWDRVNNALLRSMDIIPSSGEYLMNISIGTPPHPVLLIADTGNDLIWTQCTPCTNCFKQDAPLFDPAKSSTYQAIPCDTGPCEVIENHCPSDNNCTYSAYIGEECRSEGVLSTDSFTLPEGYSTGSPPIDTIVFGCGTNNVNGTFDGKVSGVLGLSGSGVSFISQLSYPLDSTINKTFSYCLDSGGLSSKINFGSNSVVKGSDVVRTRLVKIDSERTETFYYVNLEAITVDKERVNFTSSDVSLIRDGKIIMGTGTALTILPLKFYSNLRKAVSSRILASPVESPIYHPSQKGVNLCYKVGDLKNVPEITANFEGGDVKLKLVNTFVQVSEDVTCFAFLGADHRLPVYGNLAQMDFLVGYDLPAATLSFKPASCTATN